MKRFLSLLMVLGLLVGSVASAEAKAKKRPLRVERTVEGTYGPYPAPVTGCNEPLGHFACLIVESRPTEAFFTAKVTDTHGQPVLVVVSVGETGVAFCGETSEPIRFSPGAELRFHIAEPEWPTSDAFLRDCRTNRVKTTGTISVTLSNLP